MVEFALVAPMLFVLVFGVFEFGSMMSANVTVTNSSREGARLLAAQVTQHARVDGNPSKVFGVIGCPGGAASAPTAPPPGTAEGAAWRQMANANLALKNVTKLQVRFYAANHDPASAAPDDVFDCTLGTSTPIESGCASTPCTYTPAPGSWAQFETDYVYNPSTPFISRLVPTVTVAQTTTMVLE